MIMHYLIAIKTFRKDKNIKMKVIFVNTICIITRNIFFFLFIHMYRYLSNLISSQNFGFK